MLLGTFTRLLAMSALSRAAIVEMFGDKDCWNYLGEVNVWDNTCASWMEKEWQSFRIKAPGGWAQAIASYKHGSCVYPAVACVSASIVGKCYAAYGRAFGSSLLYCCE